MPLHPYVPEASDFEPSTLTADFDDVVSELDADAQPVDADPQSASQADFAAAFGPVASRWEAMLRWYEMTEHQPAVTH